MGSAGSQLSGLSLIDRSTGKEGYLKYLTRGPDQSELSPEPAPRGPLLGFMFLLWLQAGRRWGMQGRAGAGAVYPPVEKFPHEHMVWL